MKGELRVFAKKGNGDLKTAENCIALREQIETVLAKGKGEE